MVFQFVYFVKLITCINISSIIYYKQVITDCGGSKNSLKQALENRNNTEKII